MKHLRNVLWQSVEASRQESLRSFPEGIDVLKRALRTLAALIGSGGT